MSTARDLIEHSLRDAGVVGRGQTASGADIVDGLTRLNALLAQWRVKRWLVYRLVDMSVVSTGAAVYTIGPGGAIAIAVRPDRLDGAYRRQLGITPPVDTPVEVIQSREDYIRIAVKSISAPPSHVWYDNAWPLGSIVPWPVPQAGTYELHVLAKFVLDDITEATLSDALALPGEYYNAVMYNLSVQLRAAAQLPPNPISIQLARIGMNTIRSATAQVPLLQMPREVLGLGARFNFYTGNSNP